MDAMHLVFLLIIGVLIWTSKINIEEAYEEGYRKGYFEGRSDGYGQGNQDGYRRAQSEISDDEEKRQSYYKLKVIEDAYDCE